jgi:hypothetical protein
MKLNKSCKNQICFVINTPFEITYKLLKPNDAIGFFAPVPTKSGRVLIERIQGTILRFSHFISRVKSETARKSLI